MYLYIYCNIIHMHVDIFRLRERKCDCVSILEHTLILIHNIYY